MEPMLLPLSPLTHPCTQHKNNTRTQPIKFNHQVYCQRTKRGYTQPIKFNHQVYCQRTKRGYTPPTMACTLQTYTATPRRQPLRPRLHYKSEEALLNLGHIWSGYLPNSTRENEIETSNPIVGPTSPPPYQPTNNSNTSIHFAHSHKL